MTAAFYDDPNYTYGHATRKYDEVPTGYDANRLHWRFEVAWISSYNYWSEANGQTEAIYAESCYWKRGRDTFVNYDGEGFTRMAPGRMVIKLINKDNRYDPDNASSVLYPNVAPGKLCRLGVRLASQTTYTWRFTGMITNIRPYRTDKGESMVEIEATDGWGWLQDRVLWIPMLQGRDTSASSIIPLILEELNWPKMWLYSASDDAVDINWFWSGTNDARNIIHDFAEANGSVVYIGGEGRMYYFPRNTIWSNVGTFTQSDILKDVPVNNPWDNKWNYVIVNSRSLTDFAEYGTLWGDVTQPISNWDITVTDEFAIASGGTITVSGRFEKPRGFTFEDESTFLFGHTGIGGSFPVTISFEFMTGTGGTGTKRTGYVEVMWFKENGETFEAVLKNNYSATLYSTYFSVIGYGKVFVPAKSLSFTADRSDGKPIRPFYVNSPYIIHGLLNTTAVLQDVANDYADMVTGVNKLPVITFEAQPTKQFLQIMNRLTLSITKIGVSDDFMIGSIEERWLSPTAQAVETKVVTEPYIGA